MVKLSRIVFVTGYALSSDSAASTRVLNMAKALRSSGNEVFVVGPGGGREFVADGINFVDTEEGELSRLSRFGRSLMFDSRLRRALMTVVCPGTIIIPYLCSFPMKVGGLVRLARACGASVVGDVSERYSPRQFSWPAGPIQYVMFEVGFRVFFERCDALICASSYLASYFERRGVPCLTLNGVMDLPSKIAHSAPDGPAVVLYAGAPGRKDKVLDFVLAYSQLSPEVRSRLMLRFVGLSPKEAARLRRRAPGLRTEEIDIWPRVPRATVLAMLSQTAFSILLRPNRRYARAGFPSKVCESFATGVPLIGNSVGDLGHYLTSENSIVIAGDSLSEIRESLERAAWLSADELGAMRLAARRVAEREFGLRVCSERLGVFLSHVVHAS